MLRTSILSTSEHGSFQADATLAPSLVSLQSSGLPESSNKFHPFYTV